MRRGLYSIPQKDTGQISIVRKTFWRDRESDEGRGSRCASTSGARSSAQVSVLRPFHGWLDRP